MTALRFTDVTSALIIHGYVTTVPLSCLPRQGRHGRRA